MFSTCCLKCYFFGEAENFALVLTFEVEGQESGLRTPCKYALYTFIGMYQLFLYNVSSLLQSTPHSSRDYRFIPLFISVRRSTVFIVGLVPLPCRSEYCIILSILGFSLILIWNYISFYRRILSQIMILTQFVLSLVLPLLFTSVQTFLLR